MNSVPPTKSRRPSLAYRKKLGVLCPGAALALLLSLSPLAGLAQEKVAVPEKTADEKTPTEKTVVLDTLVVNGIRASMAKALDIKRANVDNLVDSIVAEDIGKFPDNNVVESLQRLTGVQVTDRGNGQISTVTIRGLPDASTTVNGRNVFTASGTGLSLPDIPATLLSQVTVYKTRSADLLETGLAGQIDIQTHRPFDFAGDKASVAVRGIYADLPKKIGPNYSGLLSKRWENSAGKFGALINVSYSETPYRNESVTPGAQVPFMTDQPAAGWVPYQRIFTDGANPWQPGLTDGLPAIPGSTMLINGVATPYVLSRDAIFQSDGRGTTKRPAANVSLQFAPSKDAVYTLEAFYDGYRNKNFNNLLFSFVDWWGGPLGAVTLYPGTNIVKSRASVANVYSFNSGDYSDGKTDSYIVALNAKWNITPDFKLTADVSGQSSDFKGSFFATRVWRISPSIAVDFDSHAGLPAFSFPGSNIADPSVWNMGHMWDQGNHNKGSAATLKVDGDYTLNRGFLKNVRFGVRYDDRSASEASRAAEADPLPTTAPLLSQHPELVYINSDFFQGRAAVPSSWADINGFYTGSHEDAMRTLYGLPLSSTLQTTENFHVNEVNSAAYVMGNIDTYVGGLKLDGQAGLRYVSVKTDMTFGTSASSASVAKLLPSAMLRLGLTEKLKLRVSYGETLRRPNFGDLNPTITYQKDVTNIGYGTAGGGNPDLKPTHSKNYDLALEYYLDDASGLFATAFERDIEGLVIPFRRRVTYQNYDYILSQPYNASNGKLTGGEFGGMYFPKNLPGMLQGLGVQASFTLLHSSQDIPITNSAGVIIGKQNTPFYAVSDRSYNVVLAYERKKFSARVSQVWRAAFLHHSEAPLFANPLGVYDRPEKSLDAQLSYRISKDFEITVDGTNLTKEIYQSYYGNKPGNSTTNNFGNALFSRTIAVGARYSF